MATGPTPAAPREKEVKFAPQEYKVLEKSFINGKIVEPGEVVRLPEGVMAGKNLKPVGGAKAQELREEETERDEQPDGAANGTTADRINPNT